MRRLLLASLVLVLALTTLGIAGADDAPTKAATAWLHLVDGGDYAGSYKQASALFKKQVTEAGWVAAMKQARAPLAKVISRKLAGSQMAASLPGAPQGQYAVMQFTTDFEKKKGATETVTFAKDGSAWRMAGYYIR